MDLVQAVAASRPVIISGPTPYGLEHATRVVAAMLPSDAPIAYVYPSTEHGRVLAAADYAQGGALVVDGYPWMPEDSWGPIRDAVDYGRVLLIVLATTEELDRFPPDPWLTDRLGCQVAALDLIDDV
jgi:hypothetical protein